MSVLTRRTDYAVRLLLELATLGEHEHLSTRELCRRQGIPHPFARRIITELSAAGLVATRRGSGGGVRLARPAATITVFDVMAALGDDVALAACVHDAGACPAAEGCLLQRVWGQADQAVRDYLRGQDLASLADSRGPLHRAGSERRTASSTTAGAAGRRPVVSTVR
jgi:Rrf2 family protein